MALTLRVDKIEDLVKSVLHLGRFSPILQRMGRLLYVLTPFALLDFVAIFPSYIALYTGIAALDFLFLRSIRLLRVLRIFKLGRYNNAFTTVQKVIITASIMLAEFHHPGGQVDNIPGAMW